MPRVFVIASGGDAAFRDLRASPYRYLLEQLAGLGEITPHLQSPGPKDVLVAFEPLASIREFAEAMLSGTGRRHMIVREPHTVRPDLYSSRTRAAFDHSWAQSPSWARELGGEPFFTPLHIPEELADLRRDAWEGRSNVPCLLLANKYSAVGGDMYWLRRALMSESGRRDLPIDVIGSGWEMSGFTKARKLARASATALQSGLRPRIKATDLSLRNRLPHTVRVMGNVEDKYATLSTYQLAFVPENSREYVSEKLLDAVVAGCIPIYVGGNIADFGFPEGMCLTPEPSAEAMWDAAEEVAGWSWEKRRECLAAGQEYVHSQSFIETWRNDHSLRSLGARIVSKVKASAN
jgi:hypothetical protein